MSQAKTNGEGYFKPNCVRCGCEAFSTADFTTMQGVFLFVLVCNNCGGIAGAFIEPPEVCGYWLEHGDEKEEENGA